MLGQVDFSDIAILCNRPNNCCQQNLKCFDEPLFSLGLFSWKSNSNSVNYPACIICSSKAGSLRPTRSKMCWNGFEHSLPGKTRLWLKKQKETKNCVDKVIVRLLLFYLRPPLASRGIQVSNFFGTNDNPFCLCLLIFAEEYTSKPIYRH